MNANHDLERRVADYYASEAPSRAPDWVLGSVLATIDATQQRRAPIRVPWRFPIMSVQAKVAMAAVAVVAVGAVGLAVLRPGPAPSVGDSSPPPSPSATPSASGAERPALSETFTSSMHGISVSYPTGWTVQPATEPWSSGEACQACPFTDVIYEKESDTPFIAVASQTLGSRAGLAWATDYLGGLRDVCKGTEPVTVDGATGLQGVECRIAMVSRDGRGYLIWLYRIGDRAWFEEILASVRLHPEDAVALTTDFRKPFSYKLPAGADFEVAPEYGEAYFEVRIPAAYEAGTASGLIVQAIGGGRADPCDGSSRTVPIGTGPQAVIDYMRTVPDVEVTDEAATTVGGLPAVRATVAIGAGTPACQAVHPWAEGGTEWVPRGIEVNLIAVEVDGEHIVLTTFGESANPEWDTMADELVASIRFR